MPEGEFVNVSTALLAVTLLAVRLVTGRHWLTVVKLAVTGADVGPVPVPVQVLTTLTV